MAKKSTRSKAARSQAKADTEAAPRATGDRLVGAVWHNGKLYDAKKPGDQEAFKKLVENEKKLGDKNKDGSPRAQLDLQRLADEGVVSGYGTKAKSRKAAKAKDADVELDEEFDPNAPAGGGIDAVEEQELMDEELEEQEEER